MNPPKKKQKTSYLDRIEKDWSGCSAGFEELHKWKAKTVTKDVNVKRWNPRTDECSREEQEEDEGVEEEAVIDWSSSSDEDAKEVKGLRTLGMASLKKKSHLRRNPSRPAPRRQQRGPALVGSCSEERGMVFGAKTGQRTPPMDSEELCISDSSSDSGDLGIPRIPVSAVLHSQYSEEVAGLERGEPLMPPSKTSPCERGINIHIGQEESVEESGLSGDKNTQRDKTFRQSCGHPRRSNAQSTSPKSSCEPEILDYESPEESINEELSISTCVSDTSSLPAQHQRHALRGPDNADATLPGASPRTGSEWVKKLKLQAAVTPEKADHRAGATATATASTYTSGRGDAGDSARKKRKFLKLGLAERLQRLVNREKSSVAMWYHNQHDSQGSQQGRKSKRKSKLVVRVLSLDSHMGLYAANCLLLQGEIGLRDAVGGDASGSRPNARGGGRGGMGEEGAGTGAGAGRRDEAVCVLFARATAQRLGLGKDSVIAIHTPWQKLFIPNYSRPVILCTHFCRPLNSEADHGSATGESSQAQPQLIPDNTDKEETRKFLRPMKLFSQNMGMSPSLGGADEPGRRQPVSSSIMECVSEIGGCSSSGISFKARVQRVVQRKQQRSVLNQSARGPSTSQSGSQWQGSPAPIWSLLLQDGEGVVCELQLSNQMSQTSTWQPIIQSGEGRSYIFTRLRLTQRLTRARAQGLFSMVDMLTGAGGSVGAQAVCYILTSELGVTTVEPLDQGSDGGILPPPKPPVLQSLSDIMKISRSLRERVSFLATALLMVLSGQEIQPLPGPWAESPTGSWLLFLSGPSLITRGAPVGDSGVVPAAATRGHGGDKDFACLQIHQSCTVPEAVSRTLQTGGRRVVVQCKDVVTTLGQHGADLSADGYSHIIVQMEAVELGEDDFQAYITMATPQPQSLSAVSKLFSLVTVEGLITGVEEESAFSWPACPHCGNNHLDGGEGSGFTLHCSGCRQDILSPLTRMHLVIFLKCEQPLAMHSVRVQVLQSTIEGLLSSSSASEGGHDLQGILGVHLGPLKCLLRSTSGNSNTVEQKGFMLEEVHIP
ncbi:DNA repair-scaffolding protein-like [Diadema antillarum]|uniref:DNA repair-scaffolding protein-like n=1 Tax=Diadema antillarum TaxID=105358 RepID=UPI003A8B45DE